MQDFVLKLSVELLPLLWILGVVLIGIIVYWLFFQDGLDWFKNRDEYKDKGATGERLVYLSLIKKYHIPEEQIFHNVYFPIGNGRTTEIDLIVLSKKGLMVFECKNYAGNIYGDGNKDWWIQYLGKKKSRFLSPIIQNRGHVKRIKEYFSEIEELPVVPFVVTTTRGKWKLKNIKPEDHFMGYNGVHFGDVYDSLEDSEVTMKYYRKIRETLGKFERPDESTRREHIKNIKY